MKGKTKKLSLSRGKFAIVDADFELLLNAWRRPCKYYYSTVGYAMTIRFGKIRYLHRDVFERRHGTVPENMTVDHVDRDKLNNTSSNLRLADHFEQRCNSVRSGKASSKFKGVHKYCERKKNGSVYTCWRVKLQARGVSKARKFKFTPEGEIAAARQYDEWARELHGEFAVLNFPNKDGRK